MRRAILLGLLQGPTELAPVSSSAHTALLWRHGETAFAKTLQVALHGGTACALALSMGSELRRTFVRIGSGVGRGVAARSGDQEEAVDAGACHGPAGARGCGDGATDQRRALATGAGASSVSTLIAAQLLSSTGLSRAPLAPFCVYRIAFALALLAKGPLQYGPRARPLPG